MSFDVQIELRKCASCGRGFKTMTSSKAVHCSAFCLSGSGIAAPGERPKASKENARPTETISVKIGTPRTAANPAAAFSAIVGNWPTRKKKELEPSNITSETRSNKMQNETQTEKPTSSVIARPLADVTARNEPSDSPKFTAPAIVETPRDSSDGQLLNLNLASSGILNLSRRSAERLLRLMETIVTDEDIEKQGEGLGRVDVYKVETAIRCANGIAQIVQTNINLLKAMKGNQ